MKSKKTQICLIILVFLIGLGILLYPSASDLYNKWKYDREIAAWEASREKKNYSSLWAQAEAYNQELAETQRRLALSESRRAYVSTLLNPLGNGMMGYVDIPKIEVHLPIYQGTEEKQLQSGCGWWFGTSLPTGGDNTHCVITAHNGLVKAKLFTDLDKLLVGDRFSLTILDRVMLYEVDQILTVQPDDFEPLKIVPGEDYVTLYTCTPYGVNMHRLLVRGHRIEEPEAKSQKNYDWVIWLLAGSAVAAVLLLIACCVLWIISCKRRKHIVKHIGRSKRKKV